MIYNLTLPRLIPPKIATTRPCQTLPHILDFIMDIFHEWVAFFVTIFTKRFEIRRVISTMFREFKNMMTMTFDIFGLISAGLANSIIAFVNILLEPYPDRHWWSAIPGNIYQRNFFYRECCHTISLPTRHELNQPHLTQPGIAVHHHSSSITTNIFSILVLPNIFLHRHTRTSQFSHRLSRTYPNSPNSTRHRLTAPMPQYFKNLARANSIPPYPTFTCRIRPLQTASHKTAPDRTLTTNSLLINLALPDHINPILATPLLASPGLAMPFQTLATNNLLVNRKIRQIETTKARAIIANSYRFSGKNDNILQECRLNFIVNHLDFKIQRPSRLECWTQADNARAIDDNRAHIQVKQFIRIQIERFGNKKTIMRDAIRGHKDIRLKQIFVSFTALAGHLESNRCFYKRTDNMISGLKNLTVRLGVKVFSPFLAIIFCAGRFTATIGKRFKFRHWETMLHQRGNSYNRAINTIHFILQSWFICADYIPCNLYSQVRVSKYAH